ncbi:hypothetical protein LshimejAT787_0404410 [Lyophyllum shimeji]|uniref:Uncharacterized protein n=1 Tax=Lyophyllum shimeji TaxID=47721 RepID=A0A9P3UN28_LYOSH|nr:hypothetical protein LshimejAT787_0404410 [Lyophyllum shimeji]
MEPLRKLRDLVAKVDYNGVSRQDHREIYKYIEREVLSPKSPIIKHVPPLEVIVYSMRNILLPDLATRRIPELLDLLATVEFYRKRTLDYAQKALVWNDYYKTEGTAVTLSHDEEEFLRKLESQESDLRKVYITILTTCCELDMYLLWTATPPSIADAMIRFNEYFPFLNENCDSESPRLFHSDLSDSEAGQVEDVGLKFCDFAQATIEWATEYAGDGQTMHSVFSTEEFRESFPRPCEDDKLSELISYFAKCVTSASQGIEEIFGDGDS